ncbi:MAG: exodeoxyribonuclease VII large subunit [Epsilonproteobacteria bacterium]|nr:exodeoxyribonuclease VII large subunit [Campylobacterota bacterium]
MLAPITVTTLNNQIKSLLESHYLNIMVEGEVSRVTYHGSGHLYFTLKDKNSAISCVMFKGNNQKLKFRVEEGMQVIIGGGISVYTPRGSYQINCATMEPAGSGALALAYEQLKSKLESKGYFEQSIKKALPKSPSHIALITSGTGAALQDMLNVAQKRWPLVKITLFDTIVQGESAAPSIAKNIALADKIGAEVIVIGRGGGSLEDLWAFNEEKVADAIYQASTPLVSAVGHEIDFLISDFTADLRAPTPSAAMELILPDQNEMRLYIDTLMTNFNHQFKKILEQKSKLLEHQQALLKQNSFTTKLSLYQSEINNLQANYHNTLQLILNNKSAQLEQLHKNYQLNNPSTKDRSGYAQISKDGALIALEKLTDGDIFSTQTSQVEITAKVLEVKQNKDTK